MSKQVIDACCLINFYGSRQQREILKSYGGFYIPESVEQETLRIRLPLADDEDALVLTDIDLSAEINDSLLIRCSFESEAELDDYVAFAAKLDDGEAACLAIAQNRELIVATDDRKAIRLANDAGIETLSTPAIMKNWIEAQSVPREVAAEALQGIENHARFRLKTSHELYDWWQSILED